MTVWQRAAVAIKRNSIPIISKVVARPRARMRRSITPLKLRCMNPAGQLGFGWPSIEDECLAAIDGASLATSRQRGGYHQSEAAHPPSLFIFGRSERYRGLSARY